MPDLKPISKDAVEAAMEKAERYRLLNEPREAESICRDILCVSPGHQPATIMLLLALTDQFGKGYGVDLGEVRQLVPELQGDYERAYFTGVILERWGKSRPATGAPADAVNEWLRCAMESYAQAETIRPAGNDDAILRWNACARMIGRASRSDTAQAAPTEHQRESFDDEVPMI